MPFQPKRIAIRPGIFGRSAKDSGSSARLETLPKPNLAVKSHLFANPCPVELNAFHFDASCVHNALMKNHFVILAAAMSAFFVGTPAVTDGRRADSIMQEKGSATMHANGTFEVKLTPQDSGDKTKKALWE